MRVTYFFFLMPLQWQKKYITPFNRHWLHLPACYMFLSLRTVRRVGGPNSPNPKYPKGKNTGRAGAQPPLPLPHAGRQCDLEPVQKKKKN